MSIQDDPLFIDACNRVDQLARAVKAIGHIATTTKTGDSAAALTSILELVIAVNVQPGDIKDKEPTVNVFNWPPRRSGESDQKYLRRLTSIVDKLDMDDWHRLPEVVKEWANAACTARNQHRQLPPLPADRPLKPAAGIPNVDNPAGVQPTQPRP